MVCKNCGSTIEENTKFCASCGTRIEENDNQNVGVVNEATSAVQQTPIVEPTVTVQPTSNATPTNVNGGNSSNQQTSVNNDNTKVTRVLSYIGILFLVGLCGSHKNDKNVRFHVGQGMLVFILGIIVSIIQNFIVVAIFKNEITVFGIGTGEYVVSELGILIDWILWLMVFVLEIIGIVNAVKNENKPLPIIGSLAFYK